MIFFSRSGWKVSTWTLMRVRPAAFSGAASWGSSTALVVMATSRMPSMRARRATMSTMSVRRVGSPPVSRKRLKPTCAAARPTVSISSAVRRSGDGTKVSPRIGMQ